MNLLNQLGADLNPSDKPLASVEFRKAIETSYQKMVNDEIGLLEEEGAYGLCAECGQEAQIVSRDDGYGPLDCGGQFINHVDIQYGSKCCEAIVLDPEIVIEWMNEDIADQLDLDFLDDDQEQSISDYIKGKA